MFRDTVVETTFDSFRSPRYLTTFDMKRLREVAALAPYDTILVMVNAARYGGGGIFNSYSIFTSDSEYSKYVMLHEFGHGFGALGDEYFSSSTGYEEDEFYKEGTEPWEPNVTAERSREKIKWGRLIDPKTRCPPRTSPSTTTWWACSRARATRPRGCSVPPGTPRCTTRACSRTGR